MRRTALPPGAFAAMGTIVSVRPGLGAVRRGPAGAAPGGADPVEHVRAVFARWEARCSLFDPESELSRVGRGELSLVDAGAEVRHAYALALQWRDATGGRFTPHRGDGLVDLNGVVKALAVQEAGEELDHLGRPGWAIDAGGDLLVADEARVAVGIVDPADRSGLLGRIDLDGVRRRAVATSGSAERGDHIWTAPGVERTPFVQVTVAAGDLLTADVLATAIVAGGHPALDELARRHDVDVLAVEHDGALLATPGWPRAAAAGTS
ncbi:FAD:protein FMN transferase [Agromyces sp. SYSU T0242]|uniref:FAD:protein FMN transferase n=1 Tax=Agromyces litoreus TaxID=3158561 RepID=UPI00339A225C